MKMPFIESIHYFSPQPGCGGPRPPPRRSGGCGGPRPPLAGLEDVADPLGCQADLAAPLPSGIAERLKEY